MRIESFNGIILSEVNYSDSSKILNVLTDKFGLIGVMSKGCRRVKSKLSGVSRKFIYGKFDVYYKEDKMSTLINIDLINSFPNILTDLETISYASLINDLVLQVLKQNNDTNIFNIYKDTLIKLEEGYNKITLTNIIELKLLDYLGVHPEIDCCGNCGSNEDIVTLSIDSGGYLCKNCYKEGFIVDIKTIKIIRLYYYVDIGKITKLDISTKIDDEINKFLEMYYDKYTGVYLKSKEFIKRIKQINNN